MRGMETERWFYTFYRMQVMISEGVMIPILCFVWKSSTVFVKLLYLQILGSISESLIEVLCVFCRGGIAIWSANYPGNMAPVRAGVVSILGTPNRGTGARWALVDFLRTGNNAPVTALSWSPCGRYPLFFVASLFHPRFCISVH